MIPTHPRRAFGFRSGLLMFVWLLAAVHVVAQPRWWMTEPVRFFQTNLPENYSTLDSDALVNGVADFGANVLLFNMGGVAAQYPTEVDLHYRSRWLPEGRDLFGEVLEKAHARGVRVIGRFDLSKTQRPVFEAHPEWFFKRANGESVIYHGLYSACINGGYYSEHAPKILREALTRYQVDGLFFNMFGNPSRDYSGVPMGPCHCDACAQKFRALHGRELPADDSDPVYREFLYNSAKEVAAMIGELMRELRPEAAFFTYIDEYTDVIVHESNTSVTRPLPLWPYSASDNVNRSLNSGRDKVVFNLCMSFVDYAWRFIHVPQGEVRLRLWQNLAHGAAPALVVLGSFDQEDTNSLVAARPIFDWHKLHEDLYVGQQSAARVLVLHSGGGSAYRGVFRILSEKHIPFAVTTDLDWLTDGRKDDFDLVIAPQGAPAELAPWVEDGGRLLVMGAESPPIPMGKVVAVHSTTQSSWRIHPAGAAMLPSLKYTRLLILDSAYAELAPLEEPLLTLIPPAMWGPPELVWLDKVETQVPGLLVASHGKGRAVWAPWDVGTPYFRYSSEGHSGLIGDLVDFLLPEGRQLVTDAHPLIEITVMNQPGSSRTLVHFVNVSGHSSTGYFPPLATGPVEVSLDTGYTRARAVKLAQELVVRTESGRMHFVLPSVGEYEVVVLE